MLVLVIVNGAAWAVGLGPGASGRTRARAQAHSALDESRLHHSTSTCRRRGLGSINTETCNDGGTRIRTTPRSLTLTVMQSSGQGLHSVPKDSAHPRGLAMAGLPSVPTHASANIRPTNAARRGWDKARVWRTMKNRWRVQTLPRESLAHRTKPAKASASPSSKETANAVRKRRTDGRGDGSPMRKPCLRSRALVNFSSQFSSSRLGWTLQL